MILRKQVCESGCHIVYSITHSMIENVCSVQSDVPRAVVAARLRDMRMELRYMERSVEVRAPFTTTRQ